MKSRETLIRLKKFQVDEKRRKVAQIEAMMAEGDTVWMRFNTGGTHNGSLASIAPTGKRAGVPVAMIARFVDGKWVESWTFADELGFLLQLGQPDLLL